MEEGCLHVPRNHRGRLPQHVPSVRTSWTYFAIQWADQCRDPRPLDPRLHQQHHAAGQVCCDIERCLCTDQSNAGIKFIDPTDEACKEWKKRINALSDISLFPTTKSTYMGGSLPGKAFEQVNYAGGEVSFLSSLSANLRNLLTHLCFVQAKYKEEIRSKLPGFDGFRVVKQDAGKAAA